MLSDATLAYGEDLIRALLGVDALYVAEQRPLSPPTFCPTVSRCSI